MKKMVKPARLVLLITVVILMMQVLSSASAVWGN
jgi:hypothetical protein